ncbi:hypothetical protein MXD62_20090 [Frankia sp. Mgl5]|uniref:hypothetical protein n=1 Tax=Frankia sp. Mgl5 TaxID=2933793 RepID=UPI00200F41C1|nr:hypothetical protein [Frankia sp. Mgl5]MCK9929452.1 hypothetical protein [Frankia sp. Mgl5]
MIRTHTRTHVHITHANPYLTCDECGQWITGWHDDSQCGCDNGFWNLPCKHGAGATSACPSWGPVDGCSCQQHLGHVPHGEPPAPAETSAEGERRA